MSATGFYLRMIAEHFLGIGSLKPFIRKRRFIYERNSLRSFKRKAGFREIEEVDFHKIERDPDFSLPDRPVIFKGVAANWDCCTKWNFDFIRQTYGDDPALLLFPGSGSEDLLYEETTLSNAVSRMTEDKNVNLRFQPLLQRHPELVDDLKLDFYSRLIPSGAMNANRQFFMAAGGAFTPIHTAIQNLLFLQVYGEKEWIVYPPGATFGIGPKVDRTPYFFSDFNPTNELDQEIRGNYLDGYRIVLHPGDILYLPTFWWHFVRNLSDCISVGFRWTTIGSALRASKTLTLLTLFSAHPPVWTTMKQKEDFTKVVMKRGKVKKVDTHKD